MERGLILTAMAGVILISSTFFSYADTIILNDGRKIDGLIVEEQKDAYIVKIKIGTTKINKDTIKEIKKVSSEENYLRLGDQYLAANNLDAAAEQYEKALQVNPKYQPAKDALAQLEKSKKQTIEKKGAEMQKKEKDSLDKMEGLIKSFGLKFEPDSDEIVIAVIIKDGSADSVGLKQNDRIVQINDLQTKGKTVEEIINYLYSGDSNSFDFTVEREVKLTRKKIEYQNKSFVGVGIFLDSAGGKLVINSLIIGEAADRASLKQKDTVIAINGKSAVGMSVDDAAALIGGEESAALKLTIQRTVEIERRI